MANQQIRAQQLFRYRRFQVNKIQPLGHGAYGAVYKAKCDQLPCAAKILHPTILDPNDPGAGRIMQRFQQECTFLVSIRHPNIVQYLGMTRDSESRLPVLLMELLDESLTKMLEHSQRSLAYCVQVDICHDIAVAMSYLHSNDIIHRDLSSNNVLIMAKSRAKVTDFGMSKLAGTAPSMTPLTSCPGTVAYMPPEALDEPPVYTKKLDCFSEGVIMIQVCTRLWPEPGPRTKTVPFPASPTGTTKVPVLEPERRKNHIDMIDPGHGLLPIAVDCLHYQENGRPSSEELCQRLAGLKETREYRESIEQVERVQNDITHVDRQMREMQVREAATIQQLQELRDENQQLQQRYESEIQSKDGQIQTLTQRLNDHAKNVDKLRDGFQQECQTYRSEIQSKVGQIQILSQQLDDHTGTIARLRDGFQQERQKHQSEIQTKDRKIQKLQQQLKDQEQVTAEIQQTNNTLLSKIEELQQQLRPSQPPLPVPLPLPRARVRERQLQLQDQPTKEAQSQPSAAQQDLVHRQKLHAPARQLKLGEWRDGGKAPCKMARGAAVVDGNVAYFMSWDGRICSYDCSTLRWSELTRYPHWHSRLAVIRGLLTGIGGSSELTNVLLSMIDNKWVEHFRPMPTKRSSTAVASTKKHLVVAGGMSESPSKPLDTVEVMDVETLVWSTAASLPYPYSSASVAVCGDQLYMLGGRWEYNFAVTKSVLTCSLTRLLQSCGGTSSNSVWHRVTAAPVCSTTCAAVNGELVAVGGADGKNKTTSAVHKYNSTTDSWDVISNMPTARYCCLVAVLPTNEMLAVGGNTTTFNITDNIVEIANWNELN